MLEVRFKLNFALIVYVVASRVDTEECCLLVCVFLLDVSWFLSVCYFLCGCGMASLQAS
jgi:hypothetical protein